MMTETDNDAKKYAKEIEIYLLNERAYGDIIMSIDKKNSKEGRVVFQIVKQAKTKYLSKGDTARVYKDLNNKYDTKTAPLRFNFQKEGHKLDSKKIK